MLKRLMVLLPLIALMLFSGGTVKAADTFTLGTCRIERLNVVRSGPTNARIFVFSAYFVGTCKTADYDFQLNLLSDGYGDGTLSNGGYGTNMVVINQVAFSGSQLPLNLSASDTFGQKVAASSILTGLNNPPAYSPYNWNYPNPLNSFNDCLYAPVHPNEPGYPVGDPTNAWNFYYVQVLAFDHATGQQIGSAIKGGRIGSIEVSYPCSGNSGEFPVIFPQ